MGLLVEALYVGSLFAARASKAPLPDGPWRADSLYMCEGRGMIRTANEISSPDKLHARHFLIGEGLHA